MKAVVLRSFGPAENLAVEDRPVPELKPAHVLIRVEACGVGYRDVIDRRGDAPYVRLPIVPGHEFAGEVVGVGEGVARFAVGDRVLNLYAASCGRCPDCVGGDERDCRFTVEAYGVSADGGYAEYVLVHERGLEPLPAQISYEAGATMLSAVGVGFNNAANVICVRPGEKILVTGASGGVGSAAMQTAKLMGAEVWAVTSDGKKAAALRALGADQVIVNAQGDFHKEVSKRNGGRGLDAAIDCVGNPTLNGSIRSVRKRGRVVVIGNVDSTPFKLNLGYLLVNSIALLGSDNVTRAALRRAMALVVEGRIRPVIQELLPLDAAAKAHLILEQRGATGRLILKPSMP